MSNQSNHYLEEYLQSNASSTSYARATDSYLYRQSGVRPPSDKVQFIIRTVDDNGVPQLYTLDNTTSTIEGLVLTINPSSVSVNMSKMVTRTQTMTGYVEEHWGEELDTITFQGSTAAFIFHGTSISPPPPTSNPDVDAKNVRQSFNDYFSLPDTGSPPLDFGNDNFINGLATGMRRETTSYQEFKKIINLMNANAASFDIRGLIKNRYFIEISYDYACYRGYIESIDVTEDAASPFRFQYTMTFKSEKTIFYYSGNSVAEDPSEDYTPTESYPTSNPDSNTAVFNTPAQQDAIVKPPPPVSDGIAPIPAPQETTGTVAPAKTPLTLDMGKVGELSAIVNNLYNENPPNESKISQAKNNVLDYINQITLKGGNVTSSEKASIMGPLDSKFMSTFHAPEND